MTKPKKGASRRVTIVISDSLNTQVRALQSELIRKTQTTVSFSAVIAQLVRKGLAA